MFRQGRINCTLKNPPKNAVKSHGQILQKMREKLPENNIEMEEGAGPIIVTTVMSSRADADIARDMKYANVTSK